MPLSCAPTSTAPAHEKKRRAGDRPLARRTDDQNPCPGRCPRNPVEVMLTPGQAHDLTCAEPLLETVDPRALLGATAFDAHPFIDSLARRGITPLIPPH